MTPNTKNRIHSQFNNLEMIRTVSPAPAAHIHPEDVLELGIDPGETIRISNERGELSVPVLPDPGIRRGCISVSNGWWITDNGAVNFTSLGRETDMAHGATFHDNLVSISRIG